MKKLLLLACLIPFLFACGGIPTVCDKITEPSIFCDLSKKANVRFEDVGNGLIIANAVAIGEGIYTKEQALKVMKELKLFMADPVTYAAFKAEVYLKMDKYPGLLLVAELYLGQFSGLNQPIYAADRTLIIGWLDQQIKILGG